MQITTTQITNNKKLGPTRPIPGDMAAELVDAGRRLFEMYRAMDQSTLDHNKEPGKVLVVTPGPKGSTSLTAEMEGDKYHGSLSINKDQRGTSLDRRYEFRGEDVVVTDDLLTFRQREMLIYRIKHGYHGTVEHVIEG